MSWSIDFHVDEERKVAVEVDWQGPADYRLRRLDGETKSLGACSTPEALFEALLDTEWAPELEGARAEPVPT